MNSIIEGSKCVFGCYGLFILEKKSQIYAIDDYFICNFITSELLTLSHINCYAIFDNDICLCLACNKSFLLGN